MSHTFFTQNKNDIVLRISDIFGDNPKRLGNGFDGVISNNIDAYIDFTKGNKVNLNHGLFLMNEDTNDKVCDCFTSLLSGEPAFEKNGSRTPLGFQNNGDNKYKMKKEKVYYSDSDD